MSTAVATKKLTTKDKEALLKEILGHQYSSAGNSAPLLNKVIDYVGIANNAFTVTELVTFTNTLLVSNLKCDKNLILSCASMFTVYRRFRYGKMACFRSVP